MPGRAGGVETRDTVTGWIRVGQLRTPPGASGGVSVTENGVVGIVLQDGGLGSDYSLLLPIERIVQLFGGWDLPTNLLSAPTSGSAVQQVSPPFPTPNTNSVSVTAPGGVSTTKSATSTPEKNLGPIAPEPRPSAAEPPAAHRAAIAVPPHPQRAATPPPSSAPIHKNTTYTQSAPRRYQTKSDDQERPASFTSRPPWYRWPAGGAIAAGAAIGRTSAATAAAWAGPPPQAGLCWYYIDPSRRRGFWDACR
jgi:hypothetical protein